MIKLKNFSTQELLYIVVLASIGLAIKPIVTPLVHIVSTPLMVPGGSLSGGFYMMWLVLASVLTNKKGSALLVGLIQGVVVISLGYFGNHGAVSLISYSLPGLTIEIIALFFPHKKNILFCILATVFANITGATIVVLLVLRLSLIPLIISIIASSISGILGGILAFSIFNKLNNYNLALN